MTREEIIKSLDEVHGSFIEKAYILNVLSHTLQLQWDSHLAYKFKDKRVPHEKPDFIAFQVGSWRIVMETEEDNL